MAADGIQGHKMKIAFSLVSVAIIALLSLAQPARGQTSPPSGSPAPTATASTIPPPAPRVKQVQILGRISGQWKPTEVLFLHGTNPQVFQPVAASARFLALWSIDDNASVGSGKVRLTRYGNVEYSAADGGVYPVSAQLSLSRQGRTFYRTAMTGSRSGKSIVFLTPVTFHAPSWDGHLTASVTITLGSRSATGSHGFVLAGPARLMISGCVLPSGTPCHVGAAGRGFVPHETVHLYRRIILALEPRGTQQARIHCLTRQPDGCNRATSDAYGNFGPRSFWYTATRCAYGATFTYWAIGTMGDRAEARARVHGDPGPSSCST